MRFSIVLLSSFILSACGKTGALFLPEEQPEPVVQSEEQPENAAKNEQPQNQDTTSSGKAD